MTDRAQRPRGSWTVTFRALHEWALPPFRPEVDNRGERRSLGVYRKHMRWLRGERQAPLCWPWRAAQQLGWIVPSPVDIRFTPLEEVQAAPTEDDATLAELLRASGHTEVWRRENVVLALKPTAWLRLYQYRSDEGWSSMFVPNGEGSVEWHLGFAVDVPEGAYLLVLPAADPRLEVPSGLFDARAIARMNEGDGVSVAVRPREPVSVRRGDPIARFVLLHRASVSAHHDLQGFSP